MLNKDPRQTIWYGNRPLNIKKQWYNSWLLFFWFQDTKSVADSTETLIQSSPFDPTILQNSPSQNRLNTWIASQWSITIPTNWIYQFNVVMDRWSVASPWVSTVWRNIIEWYWLQKWIDYKYLPNRSGSITVQHTYTLVLDLLKWQNIMFKASHNTWSTQSVDMYVYVTQIWLI